MQTIFSTCQTQMLPSTMLGMHHTHAVHKATNLLCTLRNDMSFTKKGAHNGQPSFVSPTSLTVLLSFSSAFLFGVIGWIYFRVIKLMSLYIQQLVLKIGSELIFSRVVGIL